MKINVDEDKCIAAGQCVMAAPEVFDQRDDDGVVIVLDENPPQPQWDSSRNAAALCPAAAIALQDN